MRKTKLTRYVCYPLMFAAVAMVFITACSNNNTGSLGSTPKPSFTASYVSNDSNKVVVNSTTKNAFMQVWHFGNGQTSRLKSDTANYKFKGQYSITLTAYGHGGSDSTTKQIMIPHDAAGANLLADNGALTSNDWTNLSIPGGGTVNVSYNGQSAVFTDNAYSYGAIYQPIHVQAGVTYNFSANIKGAGMGNQSWFIVYFGTTKPSQGSDYSDNEYISVNTYVPACSQFESAFDGNIADIGCNGNGQGKNGSITFSKTETVYLVFKAGSNSGTLGAGGVTLSNVSVVKQ